jgi:ATP-dependent DNA helicase DinG
MSRLSDLITDEAMAKMKEEIAGAEGREVFFLGKTDKEKRVVEVITLARGSEKAVPAISQLAEPGDVIIHNHPSGDLSPSDADLALASRFGAHGVGSLIVDNQLSRVYVVVEPFEKKEKVSLSFDELVNLLLPKGPIAKLLTSYEKREEQLEMMRAVVSAFNEDNIALIEAGTGTGKTLAYLIPAIYWARRNEERVVVSTNTINLQEQLIHKDIPLLARALPIEFSAMLVKGRGNYLCLRKLEAVKEAPTLYAEEDEKELVDALISWAGQTATGDIADLNFVPKQSVWDELKSESDYCLRSKCAYFNDCFVNRARRKLASADILVVNHHLLFADLSLRKELGAASELSILPAYHRLILDEAHNLEDIATSYFGTRITKAGVRRLLLKLHHPKKEGKGLLPFLRGKIIKLGAGFASDDGEAAVKRIEEKLIPAVSELIKFGDTVFDDIAFFVLDMIKEEEGEKKLRITEDIAGEKRFQELAKLKVDELMVRLSLFADELTRLSKACRRFPKGMKDELSHQLIDLSVLAARVEEAAMLIRESFAPGDEERVRFFVVSGDKRRRVELYSSPLLVASEMVEAVYNRFGTVIMTSATLTSGKSFDFIKERLGLTLVEAARLRQLLLPSPFDYRKQAIIGIPIDIPAPKKPEYLKAMNDFLAEALKVTRGRAFILFTSFSHLNWSFSFLSEPLSRLGIISLKQGEKPRHQLIERFKRDINSVLFATDSFWQGVDVAGEALSCVVLTRLPFRVPTDPVLEARVEHIERQGGNPFYELSLPQAVIRFRQGMGRLIRRKSDRGAILILDRRVVDRSYGAFFLRSLPPCRIVRGSTELLLGELSRFFAGG